MSGCSIVLVWALWKSSVCVCVCVHACVCSCADPVLLCVFLHSEWMSHYPLHKCACEGDCEGVRAALECGHQVDEKDDSGYTALHCACW